MASLAFSKVSGLLHLRISSLDLETEPYSQYMESLYSVIVWVFLHKLIPFFQEILAVAVVPSGNHILKGKHQQDQ
jgi:hypothetical protein